MSCCSPFYSSVTFHHRMQKHYSALSRIMETHVCVSDTCVSNHHRGEQSIDAIERTFGELILKTLAGAVNDGDKIQMLRPTLDTIISNGNDKDGFLLEFIFFVTIECAEQDVNDRHIFRKLVKSLPAGWQLI